MGEDCRALLCPKDREMVQSGLIDELHHRIEQLGVPGVDDCLTLLSMLGKLTFEDDGGVNRPLTHMVMPLLKDGLGRLVERFCALEPGEADGECLSEAIQNYAKAISLIANWQFEPCAEAVPVAAAAECCNETAAAEEPCCEEVKPAEEPCCTEAAAPVVESCPAEPAAVEPCAEEPCSEEKPSDEPCCGEERPE